MKAGIVLMHDFVQATSTPKSFSGFTTYIEREEALNAEYSPDPMLEHMMRPELKIESLNTEVYEGFLAYMNNNDKTDGLFDFATDLLSREKIQEYKDLFNQSQDNGSPMQREIISFDTEFLIEEGIMINGEVNTKRLKRATREAVRSLIKNSHMREQPGNQYWVAAIHKNTDNIHIHISMSEYEKVDRRYDKVSQIALDKAKTSVYRTLTEDKIAKLTSELWKETIEPLIDYEATITETVVYDLMKVIPEGYTQYNRKKYAMYKPEVRKAVDRILNGSEELQPLWKRYQEMGKQMEERMLRAYGQDNRHLYQDAAKNKMDADVYADAGNKLLQLIQKYRKQMDIVQINIAEPNKVKTTGRTRRVTATPKANSIEAQIKSLLDTKQMKQLLDQVRINQSDQDNYDALTEKDKATVKQVAKEIASRSKNKMITPEQVQGIIIQQATQQRIQEKMDGVIDSFAQETKLLGLRKDLMIEEQPTQENLYEADKDIKKIINDWAVGAIHKLAKTDNEIDTSNPELLNKLSAMIVREAYWQNVNAIRNNIWLTLKGPKAVNINLTETDYMPERSEHQSLVERVLHMVNPTDEYIDEGTKADLARYTYRTAYQNYLIKELNVAGNELRLGSKTVDITNIKNVLGLKPIKDNVKATEMAQEALGVILGNLPLPYPMKGAERAITQLAQRENRREAFNNLKEIIYTQKPKETAKMNAERYVMQTYPGIQELDLKRLVAYGDKLIEQKIGNRSKGNIRHKATTAKLPKPAAISLQHYAKQYQKDSSYRLKQLLDEYEYEQDRQIEEQQRSL